MKYRAPRFLFRRYEVMRRVRPGKSFMEIGAANLALTTDLLAHFGSGLAVDFTDDLVESYEQLPEEVRRKLTISNTDIMLEKPPGEFDCVVSCEVMEHIEDDGLFLRKIRDCLMPRGQALVSVPAKAAHWTVHDELVGHLRRYEKADLIRLAEESGFDEVVVVSYGFPWINWLSVLRVWLAKRTLTERKEWNQQQQTSMSNHRQIPAWLQLRIVTLLVNKFTIYPFALFSRLFNRLDWSDGYVMSMRRKS